MSFYLHPLDMCFLVPSVTFIRIVHSVVAVHQSLSYCYSECGRLCNNYWVYTNTYWTVLWVGGGGGGVVGWTENRFLTHILNLS